MREIKKMSDLSNKVNDTATKFLFRLISNGVNQQLSGDEVSVSIANDGYLFDVIPKVIDDLIELDFSDENLTKLVPGHYSLEINVSKPDGTVEVYPSSGSLGFDVTANLKAIEGDLFYKVTFDSVLNAMDEKLSKALEVNEFGIPITKRVPMTFTLYHETSPWKIAFDNGSILIFWDYSMLATIYGYGSAQSSESGGGLINYPLTPNILRVAKGVATMEQIKNVGDSTWTYWSPNTEVIHPVQDKNQIDWTNVKFNETAGPYKNRQKEFARVLYELGVFSESQIISLGGVKK